MIGDFSFLPSAYRRDWEDAWKASRTRVFKSSLKSPQILHIFMGLLEHPEVHSGGSACELVWLVSSSVQDDSTDLDDWKRLLTTFLSSSSFYYPMEKYKDVIQQALDTLPEKIIFNF